MGDAPNYSFKLVADMVSGTVSPGFAMVKNDNDEYVTSTAAARGSNRSSGLALGFGPIDGFTVMQCFGDIAPSLSGLEPAGSGSAVRVAANGALERCTPVEGDDVVGWADPNGTLHCAFGLLPWNYYSGSSGSGLAIPGACKLEQFDAVGDGVTDDSAAMTAFIAASVAGTYNTLELGAKTYNLGSTNFVFPVPVTIRGQGWRTILKTTADGDLLRFAGPTSGSLSSIHLEGFECEGNSTGSTQCAIRLGGASPGTAPIRATIRNVKVRGFASDGFLTFNGNAEPGGNLVFDSCFAEDCGLYGFRLYIEYSALGKCSATGCGTGVYAVGGNLRMVGCDLSYNGIGAYFAGGGNDVHAAINGNTINHNSIANVSVGAIGNPLTLTGCELFEGKILVAAGGSLVTFNGCELAPTEIVNTDGRLRFIGCAALNTYFVSCTESLDGWTEFLNCRGIDDDIPTWITSRVQRDASFSTDANKVLTAQESVAETLIIAPGTITASRQLTNFFAPATKRTQRVLNKTAHALTYKWATGTTVSIAAGSWAVVGSDGTNALTLEAP